MPLGTLAEAAAALDPAREVVVYCRAGVRGAKAVQQLQARGIRRVANLTGGIIRWSEDVDPTVPKY